MDRVPSKRSLPPLAFFAEASQHIGTGHVVEALVIAGRSVARGTTSVLWINAETPARLLDRAPCPVHSTPGFEVSGIKAVAREIQELRIEGVITNFRRIQNEQVAVLKAFGCRVLCIDEWGGQRLDCDVVVNTSPVEANHQYTSSNPAFRLHAGVRFLPLALDYAAMHGMERRHQGRLRSVVVSMGGVDRSGATVRLGATILDMRPDLDLHVAIGAGFAHRDELTAMLEARPASRVTVHENPSSLADLLGRCDVGFTAGGNTLMELACVGTPGLVAHEDLHEQLQGEALASQGFGCCLGAGVSLVPGRIRDALAAFDDPAVRQRHCDAGKALVDGRGADRVLDLAAEMLDRDCTVSP